MRLHSPPPLPLCSRALGANISGDKRSQLAKEVTAWAKISPPAPLLDCCWDEAAACLVPYAFVEPVLSFADLSLQRPPLVLTVDAQRHRDLIAGWLRDAEPVLLVGPEGQGKTQLLAHCFARLKCVFNSFFTEGTKKPKSDQMLAMILPCF